MEHTSRIALAAILSLAISGGLVACQKTEEKKAETPAEHAAPPAETAKPAPPAPAGPANHEIAPPAPAPAPEPAPAEKSMLDTVEEKAVATGEAVMEGAEKAGEAVEQKTESAIDAAKEMLPGQENAAPQAPEVAPAPVPEEHPAGDAVKDAAQPVKKLEGC